MDIESYLQEYLLRNHRVNLAVDPAACERLQTAAETAEQELKTQGRARIHLPNLLRRGDEMVSLDLEIDRETLRHMESVLAEEFQKKPKEEAITQFKSEYPVMMILGHTPSSLLPRLGAVTGAILLGGSAVGFLILRQSPSLLGLWILACIGLSLFFCLKQISQAQRLWVHPDLLILHSLTGKAQQGIPLTKLTALKKEENKGRHQLLLHLKSGDSVVLAKQLPMSKSYNFPEQDLEKLDQWLSKQRVQVQR